MYDAGLFLEATIYKSLLVTYYNMQAVSVARFIMN